MKRLVFIVLMFFCFSCGKLNSLKPSDDFTLNIGAGDVTFSDSQAITLFQIWSIERCSAAKFHVVVYLSTKDIALRKKTLQELIEDRQVLFLLYESTKKFPEMFEKNTTAMIKLFYENVSKIIREAEAI